jgi:hypothetical protein
MPIEGQLVGDLIVVVASVEITFADWNVDGAFVSCRCVCGRLRHP